MKNWSIKARVLFLTLIPTSVISALFAFAFTSTRLDDLEHSLKERGLAIARQLAPASEYGVFSGNREVLQKLTAAATREADVKAVTITDAAANILASSGNVGQLPWQAAGRNEITQSLDASGMVLVLSAPVFRSQTELEEFYRNSPDGAKQRTDAGIRPVLGRVYVEISRSTLVEKRRTLLLDGLIIGLLGLLCGAVLAIRMSRDVIRPILNLTEVVENIGRGQYDVHVTSDSGGELLILENGVNAMASALRSARENLVERIAEATTRLAERTEEAERANKAKSRFLAAASHDLRQPMHALGLFVEELRGKMQDTERGRDMEEQLKILARIEASVAAMRDLLDSLLDISKLDAGVVTPSVVDFPVLPLLRRLGDEFKPLAQEKGLKLRVARTRSWGRSDPALLERILANLVSNAVRYTQRGGIVIGCRRRGQQVRIEIWDSGVGIPPEQHQNVFQEFFQLANPERDRSKGLGLGLAIVNRLACLLEHRIEIQSVPGRGSRFAVELPMGREVVQEQASVSATHLVIPDRLHGKLVVVVDDDGLSRESTLRLLAGWGCRVTAVGSGAEALARLQQDGARPDLIICDYRLREGETGMHVIQQVRYAFAAQIPAVLVSGDTAPDLLRFAKTRGYPLLHKPVRPAKLRAVVSHLLQDTK